MILTFNTDLRHAFVMLDVMQFERAFLISWITVLNTERREGKITISLAELEDQFVITFPDQGQGFPVRMLPEYLISLPDRHGQRRNGKRERAWLSHNFSNCRFS
jgi:hypothetical protein